MKGRDQMILLSNVKKAPFPGGSYKAVINSITEGHGKRPQKNNETNLHYDFSVFTGTAIVDVSIVVFAGAQKEGFCKKVNRNYTGKTKGEIDVEKHVGSVVIAKFTVYKSGTGDEYLRLVEYRPYNHKEGTE